MATVDGPTEVHLVTVARQVIKEHKPSEDNWPTQFRPRRLLESRRAFDEIVSRRLDPAAQEELSALVQHGPGQRRSGQALRGVPRAHRELNVQRRAPLIHADSAAQWK